MGMRAGSAEHFLMKRNPEPHFRRVKLNTKKVIDNDCFTK